PLEVGWQRLFVGVEKHGVEPLAVERWKHVERSSDTHFDPIRERCSLYVPTSERGVRLLDLDRQETSAGWQRARHADRRVATERSDLENAARVDRCEHHLEQPPFISRGRDRRQTGTIRLFAQRGE